jgi:hypothetical protein
MDTKDTRIWYNTRTGEVVDCKYHYDCDEITRRIREEGKMNFFRDGWTRLGVYFQNGKNIGVVEAYDGKNLKKGIDYLISKHKIHTMITEKHNTNGYDMNIFQNPLEKENIDGI